MGFSNSITRLHVNISCFVRIFSCDSSTLYKNPVLQYEAKLCIHCIVSGILNRPESDLSRIPHYCYFSLIFYAVLDSTNKHLNHCTAQNCSKNMRICGIRNCIRGIHNSLWNQQINDKMFVSLNWAVADFEAQKKIRIAFRVFICFVPWNRPAHDMLWSCTGFYVFVVHPFFFVSVSSVMPLSVCFALDFLFICGFCFCWSCGRPIPPQ